MISLRAVLEDTDWDNLTHAYGSASDAPQAVVGRLSDDPQIQSQAVGFLYMAVLHQGVDLLLHGPGRPHRRGNP